MRAAEFMKEAGCEGAEKEEFTGVGAHGAKAKGGSVGIKYALRPRDCQNRQITGHDVPAERES